MCEFYLRRRLSVSGGLGDLDVLHLNRVLAVAVRVLQLADIHCLVLRVWRGSLCKQKHKKNLGTATFLIIDSNDRKSDCGPYRSHLHHLQLDVLRLRQGASSCLRDGDVLDPLVVSLRRAVVGGQRLRELRHRLSQQICGL